LIGVPWREERRGEGRLSPPFSAHHKEQREQGRLSL
jgi:hypothetical protein